LEENQEKGYSNIFSAGSGSQIERLTTIFEEINPSISFDSIHVELRSGFIDHQLKIAIYTDHQLFEKHLRYKTRKKYTKSKALTLRELETLQPGDYVTHIDYGIGRFVGLDKITIKEFAIFLPEYDTKFKNFIDFFSICPVCKRKNHFNYLKKFFYSRNEESIRLKDTLLFMIDQLNDLDDFYSKNIEIGIPCCKCFEQLFGVKN